MIVGMLALIYSSQLLSATSTLLLYPQLYFGDSVCTDDTHSQISSVDINKVGYDRLDAPVMSHGIAVSSGVDGGVNTTTTTTTATSNASRKRSRC